MFISTLSHLCILSFCWFVRSGRALKLLVTAGPVPTKFVQVVKADRWEIQATENEILDALDMKGISIYRVGAGTTLYTIMEAYPWVTESSLSESNSTRWPAVAAQQSGRTQLKEGALLLLPRPPGALGLDYMPESRQEFARDLRAWQERQQAR